MTASRLAGRRPKLVELGGMTAAAFLLGLFALIHHTSPAIDSWDLLQTLVGWAFVASGLCAWWQRPRNHLGRLMIAAGLLWLTGHALQQLAHSSAFTAGLWIGDLWGVAFVWVLLAFPDGRVQGRSDRAAPLLLALVVGPLELVWLLFWDPHATPTNALVVWPDDRVAADIDTVQRVVVAGATVVLAVVLTRRWLAASRPLRRLLLPVLAGAASLVLGAALNVLDKFGIEAPAVRWLLLCAFSAVPIAVVVVMVRTQFARAGIGELVLALRNDPAPVEVRDAVARALGDPSLVIGYWLAEHGHYADADGQELDLTAQPGSRSTTLIDRNGLRIAALQHDPSLDSEPELLSGVVAAAAIALDNGQLHAELSARMEDLKGLQRWASTAGALERKRLERDLHDGTQQRLIALSTELALLERRAATPELAAKLVHARGEVSTSLAELRDVAHGRRPTALASSGLLDAVRSAVTACRLDATLNFDVAPAVSDSAEASAYYVVCESLANIGRHSRATSVRVDLARRGDSLLVHIVDNGIGGADLANGSGLQGLAERVAALGGRFEVGDAQGGGTQVRAEFPCA